MGLKDIGSLQTICGSSGLETFSSCIYYLEETLTDCDGNYDCYGSI